MVSPLSDIGAIGDANGHDREEPKGVAASASGALDPLETILKTEAPQPPRVGEIVEGPIIARGTAAVFVDLGPRGTGIVYGREFFLARDVLRGKKIGEVITAKVIDAENADGYVELSVNAAGRELAWEALRRLSDRRETITVTIEAANRGGLMATVEGVKAFLPVSQLTPEHYPHVEGGDREKILEALRKFVGQDLRVKIMNVDPQGEKLILSERAVMEEELRQELENFHVGDTVDGKISGIVDFGLFIRFGPDGKLEGLAHISELSSEAVGNIRERYRIGDEVKAKIIDIQGDRVSLSLRALLPQPKPTEESDGTPAPTQGALMKREDLTEATPSDDGAEAAQGENAPAEEAPSAGTSQTPSPSSEGTP